MGKINASKSQKELEQLEQEVEDNPKSLNSDVVATGPSLNSGTSLPISGTTSTGTRLPGSTFWKAQL
jgi:hypothetical protein